MNFILKHKGNKQPDLIKMTGILKEHHVQVLDGSLLPQMALLDLDDAQLQLLKNKLEEDWNIYPEKTYPLPDTRKQIKS